jgi:hypothetical protein
MVIMMLMKFQAFVMLVKIEVRSQFHVRIVYRVGAFLYLVEW